jgi:hypothetical protein
MHEHRVVVPLRFSRWPVGCPCAHPGKWPSTVWETPWNLSFERIPDGEVAGMVIGDGDATKDEEEELPEVYRVTQPILSVRWAEEADYEVAVQENKDELFGLANTVMRRLPPTDSEPLEITLNVVFALFADRPPEARGIFNVQTLTFMSFVEAAQPVPGATTTPERNFDRGVGHSKVRGILDATFPTYVVVGFNGRGEWCVRVKGPDIAGLYLQIGILRYSMERALVGGVVMEMNHANVNDAGLVADGRQHSGGAGGGSRECAAEGNAGAVCHEGGNPVPDGRNRPEDHSRPEEKEV